MTHPNAKHLPAAETLTLRFLDADGRVCGACAWTGDYYAQRRWRDFVEAVSGRVVTRIEHGGLVEWVT